jgi:hypothetical protein
MVRATGLRGRGGLGVGGGLLGIGERCDGVVKGWVVGDSFS